MRAAKWVMASMPRALMMRLNQLLVGHVADDQLGLGVDRPAKAVGEVVQHHHLLAGVHQGQHHVAADIAGSAGHQNGHAISSKIVRPRSREVRGLPAPCGWNSARTLAMFKRAPPFLPHFSDECRRSRRSGRRAGRPFLARHIHHDPSYSQGRVPGRGARHPLSAGNQSDAQGNAHRRRPAGDPARRRRGPRGGRGAFHLRHRPQQGRHRGPFRPPVRAGGDAGRARQARRARRAVARPARPRLHQLHPPAEPARPRPRGVVRPRARRQGAVRAAAAGHAASRPGAVPEGHDRRLQEAARQLRRGL